MEKGTGLVTISRSSTLKGKLHSFYHRHPTASPLSILIISIIVFWMVVGGKFIAPFNLSIIMQQVTIIGIIAVAQSIVILTSGIDLSVGSIMVLSSVVMGRLAVIHNTPVALAFLIGLAVGALCGFINGLIITRFSLPPFIVTLGTWNVFFAINLFYSKSETIRSQDIAELAPWLQFLGKGIKFLGTQFTLGTLFMIVLFIFMNYVIIHTVLGRNLVATGSDKSSVELVGINTNALLIKVYTLSGLICAFGGWAMIGRIGSVSPQAGQTTNIESITAVVIGGISLFGGRGKIMGPLVGAIIVGVFRNFLALVGVDVLWQRFAVGILIILSVAIDQWIRRISASDD